MGNIMAALIILFIIGLSIYKIIIEKRKGVKCIGCPLSGGCPSKQNMKSKMPMQMIKIKELS